MRLVHAGEGERKKNEKPETKYSKLIPERTDSLWRLDQSCVQGGYSEIRK